MTAEEKRLRAALADALATLEWIVPNEQSAFGEWPDDDPEKTIVERTRAALERSEASKRGKSNRSSGHAAERALVKYARAHGCPDAVTTRNTGGAGGRQIGDVVLAPGVVVEVKNTKTSAWPTWCRQAEDGADGRVWAVVRRTARVPDPGQWEACTPLFRFVEMRGGTPIALKDVWQPDGLPAMARVRFGTFVEAVRLDK